MNDPTDDGPRPRRADREAGTQAAGDVGAAHDRRAFLRATSRSSASILLTVPAGAAGVSLLARGLRRAGVGGSSDCAHDPKRDGTTERYLAAGSDPYPPPEPAVPTPVHEPPPDALDDVARLHAEFVADNEDVVPYETDTRPSRGGSG
jgi:hypothetical protein